MQDLENHYVTRLQGIRRQGGTVQVSANIPLPLASALDLESGETVTWKVLDRTHLLLVRLPERKQLTGEAAPPPPGEKKGAADPGAAAMMGKRSAQDKLFAADHVYLDFVGRDTLYGYMAQNREQLFRDEDFAALYCPDNGRQSVPPSLAVSLLFLRA